MTNWQAKFAVLMVVCVGGLLSLIGGEFIYMTHHHRLAEDAPGWNCHQSPNYICGPVTLDPDNTSGYVDIRDGSGRIVAVVRPENNHLTKGQ
jgi:hypothetical protein